jgi:hypothetical protein
LQTPGLNATFQIDFSNSIVQTNIAIISIFAL